MNDLKDAITDFREGLRSQFWWILSLNDLKGRYRRTVFGPWWLTLGTGIALTSIGAVWGTLFDMSMKEFFPYLSIGYVVWLMMATFLTEGCSTFTNDVSKNIQNNYVLPKSIHVFRLVSRSALVFMHHVVIFIIAAIVFEVPLTTWTLLVLPGWIALVVNGIWVTTVLGILSARYRDIEPLIAAFITLLFLVSPIIWRADALGSRSYIAMYNPITHYVGIVRDPLLGHAPLLTSWLVVGCFTVVGFVLALHLHGRFKNRLAYWL